MPVTKRKSMPIPPEFQIPHTSSVTVSNQSDVPSSALGGFYCCYENFGGEVIYVSIDEDSPPVLKMYKNNTLMKTITPSTAVSGAKVYEASFTGFSNGDTYYVTVNGTQDMPERTYTGGRGSAPTLTDTGTRIIASMSSPYTKAYSMALGVLTFNSDYGNLNTYSREARTRFVESCLQSTENNAILGKVGNLRSFLYDQYDFTTKTFKQVSAFTHEAQLYKFPEGFVINVGIVSSTSTTYYSYFSRYVNEWISDMNTLLGDELFVRDDNISEDADCAIRITIGSHKDLWGYKPETAIGDIIRIYYGTFTETRWYPDNGAVSHMEVKLCNEIRGAMNSVTAFKNIVYEELTESLGCSNDAFRVYDSIFSEIWYTGKTNRLLDSNGNPTYDGEVVKLLYKEFKSGEKISSIVHRLTPSSACVVPMPYTKYGNIANKQYSLKTYAMNRLVTWSNNQWSWDSTSNCYSDIADAFSVTPSSDTPQRPFFSDASSDTMWVNVGMSGKTYDVKLVSDTDTVIAQNLSIYVTDTPVIRVTGLNPTTEYQIYSRFSGTSDWFIGDTGFTTPEKPIVTVRTTNNEIYVKISPPANGSYDYINFTVSFTYNGEKSSEDIEKAVLNAEYKIKADTGTTFTVTAITYYIYKGNEIACYPYASIKGTVQAKTRPDNWSWTTVIDSSAYIPMDETGFHPVTALEWNNFTDRINQFREYKNCTAFTFTTVRGASNGYSSSPTVFTPAIYNEAVTAIQGISGYGTLLSSITSGTELTSALFLLLKSELNAIP